jgi:hypothetical protein
VRRAFPIVTVLIAWAACQGRLDHTFGGYFYDSTQDCLDFPSVIDVVAGADPGTCPLLRCWLAPDGSIYVTNAACDAPPDYQDQTKDGSSPCVKALAAYARPGMGICPGQPDGSAGGSSGS